MREWESDPLFSAADIVQDSADRMESIFRLLLHEQSLAEANKVDGELLSSIEYHQRDLETALKTVKWQLQDFEREVNVSSKAEKSQMRQNAIPRFVQFIGAIRDQIIHVEQSMNTSVENSLRNMNLNQQDRDGLASFLAGEKTSKHNADQESDDSSILRRFLDPGLSSSSKQDSDEKKTGNWDLEAGEAKGRKYVHRNDLCGYFGRMNFFRPSRYVLAINGSRIGRSFTKRLKDGDEQMQSPNHCDADHCEKLACQCSNFHILLPQSFSRGMQWSSRVRHYREICGRPLHCTQIRFCSVLSILALLLLTLLILCMLV